MKKCPKHTWVKIEVQHLYKMDLSPGAVNYVFGCFPIQLCTTCGKVRGNRNEKSTS